MYTASPTPSTHADWKRTFLLGVVDLGISNIGSVMRAFQRIGCEPILVDDFASVAKTKGIVLPGVGAFPDGMSALQEMRLVEPIRDAVRGGKPILGFCLGMQLLADSSEEYGDHKGLGLASGSVARLPAGSGERVPNIGWCDVLARPGARLFKDVPPEKAFYFVHSYYVQCANPEHAAATIQFGDASITASLECGNVFGLQFHPEKSQDAGLTVLKNFISVVESASAP